MNVRKLLRFKIPFYRRETRPARGRTHVTHPIACIVKKRRHAEKLDAPLKFCAADDQVTKKTQKVKGLWGSAVSLPTLFTTAIAQPIRARSFVNPAPYFQIRMRYRSMADPDLDSHRIRVSDGT